MALAVDVSTDGSTSCDLKIAEVGNNGLRRNALFLPIGSLFAVWCCAGSGSSISWRGVSWIQRRFWRRLRYIFHVLVTKIFDKRNQFRHERRWNHHLVGRIIGWPTGSLRTGIYPQEQESLGLSLHSRLNSRHYGP